MSAVLLALLVLCGGPPRDVERPPNVLVLVADDLGVDRVEAYDAHPDAGPTPVLDLLAGSGVRFTNAWAFPVCSPCRASTLTGRWPSQHGVGWGVPWTGSEGNDFVLADDEVTLPELLGRNGYRTGVVGKWHLVTQAADAPYMHPVRFGFQRHVGAITNLTPEIGDYDAWEKNVADADGAVQELSTTYATSAAVDDALAMIEDFGDDPWFVWLAFNAPHTPLHDPPDHLTTFDLPHPAFSEDLYLAMVESLDTEVGRLLSSMRPRTLDETVIVFFGDNGTPGKGTTPPWKKNHAKGKVYEGGVHVPLMVLGREVTPGTCDALVSVVDLFPTILELAGVDAPDHEGVSMTPYLADPATPSRRSWLATEKFFPNGFGPKDEHRRAARDQRYKLILREFAEGVDDDAPLVEFFDLQEDPLEEDDLLLRGTPLDAEEQAAFDHLEKVLARLPTS